MSFRSERKTSRLRLYYCQTQSNDDDISNREVGKQTSCKDNATGSFNKPGWKAKSRIHPFASLLSNQVPLDFHMQYTDNTLCQVPEGFFPVRFGLPWYVLLLLVSNGLQDTGELSGRNRERL